MEELPDSRITLHLILDFLSNKCTYMQEEETDSYHEGMMQYHEIIVVAGMYYYMPTSDPLSPVESLIVKHLKTYCKP
jgi:hypothetical protein